MLHNHCDCYLQIYYKNQQQSRKYYITYAEGLENYYKKVQEGLPEVRLYNNQTNPTEIMAIHYVPKAYI